MQRFPGSSGKGWQTPSTGQVGTPPTPGQHRPHTASSRTKLTGPSTAPLGDTGPASPRCSCCKQQLTDFTPFKLQKAAAKGSFGGR